jgi:putative transposase
MGIVFSTMPRIARIVVPEYPHHIIQRGNRRLDVFFSDADRLSYIDLLKEACLKYGVKIWAYCLMTNHTHFIAVPEKADSLARCFSDAHVRYTRLINKREGWRGHLWQARFGSSVLDERYLLAAIRYVERNPVRAGIVNKPWDYVWSSAGWHMGKVEADPLVTGDEMLGELVGEWEGYLQHGDDARAVDMLRREAVSNRPVGEKPFIKELEKRFGCILHRQKVGRPPKKAKY